MKTCLLSGNFALDTIVMRDYPNGFVVGKSNKFTETIVTETKNEGIFITKLTITIKNIKAKEILESNNR